MITLKNPENGADIKDIIRVGEKTKEYVFKVGELFSFDDEVAKVLLEKYGFLEEVGGQASKIEESSSVPVQAPALKEALEKPVYKCPHCEYSSIHKIAVIAHNKIHKDINKDIQAQLENVQIADGKELNTGLNIEDKANDNLPESGTKDRDGVGWYGQGLEDDNK